MRLFQHSGNQQSFTQFPRYPSLSLPPTFDQSLLYRCFPESQRDWWSVNIQYLHPALNNLPTHLDISNQYAYRPTSSTTAALISIFSCITTLLLSNHHVYCISFDYSKAFDTISHSSVASKLSDLLIPDHIYNWIINYLSDRSHCTLLLGNKSSPKFINASIVQGSVLGPTLFNINSCELRPLSSLNFYFKYADDAYLIVPATNSSSIPSELAHHAAWAGNCNLKLNPTKTAEIVFANKRTKEPPLNPGINRVTSMKILGVIVDNKFLFSEHIDATISSCSQSFFALRTMRQHGLSTECLQNVFKSAILSKLLYAAPSFWGFLSSANKDRLESFLRRAKRFQYYSSSGPDTETMIKLNEHKLFQRILQNPNNVLHPLLPPLKVVSYHLRCTGHGRILPRKDDRNFMNRMLYANIY